MQATNEPMRAAMSCGWMPAEARTGESCWMPDDGAELTVCAGYTTRLPDVIDVTQQFYHWEAGALDHVCPAGVPKPLLTGLTIYKNAGEARSAYRVRNMKKDGSNG